MRKRWKWLGRTIAFLILFVIIASVAFLFYIRPADKIGWPDQVEVSILDKLEQMVKNRSFSLQLNEDEINALAVQGIQKMGSSRFYVELWHVDGMRIHLQPGGMEVQVQMEPFPGIRVEANILYDMEWNPMRQSVRAVPQSVRMKGWEIPESWLNLEPMEFSIAAELPDWVKVKKFDLHADGWVMKLGLYLLPGKNARAPSNEGCPTNTSLSFAG